MLQGLIAGRSPRNESDTVKAQYAGLRSYPKVPISGLCQRIREASDKAVLYAPRGVRVLGDWPVWSEPGSWIAEKQGTQAASKQGKAHGAHWMNRFHIEIALSIEEQVGLTFADASIGLQRAMASKSFDAIRVSIMVTPHS
jgi:hypothetical protein